MENTHYQFTFASSKTADEVFAHLLDPRKWWVGIFNETIEGKSATVHDEFSFKAGDGVHYSRQKLIELKAAQKIVWQVTESHLSFLQNPNEWAGTTLCFSIEEADEQVRVTFTHKGLLPEIECYDSCSSAWTKYMHNLRAALH